MYIFILFMACCNIYTFTYGLHLWKKEGNKTGGAASMIFAVLATLLPAIVLFKKSL
ncbi:MAG: hypothetical protein N2484_00920 [Clostridia bacterium]|nr:hypothetical protein [Clostridia bacterium]